MSEPTLTFRESAGRGDLTSTRRRLARALAEYRAAEEAAKSGLGTLQVEAARRELDRARDRLVWAIEDADSDGVLDYAFALALGVMESR